jgi:hypothetical protein
MGAMMFAAWAIGAAVVTAAEPPGEVIMAPAPQHTKCPNSGHAGACELLTHWE